MCRLFVCCFFSFAFCFRFVFVTAVQFFNCCSLVVYVFAWYMVYLRSIPNSELLLKNVETPVNKICWGDCYIKYIFININLEQSVLSIKWIIHWIQFIDRVESSFVCSWSDGSLDRSSMLDPLSYFSVQPVLHDWCNKDHGMGCPVCGMVHIKEHLL